MRRVHPPIAHFSRSHPASVPGCPRLGFTIVELLVSMAIIGLLVALLLPAVSDAREASRRTQCMSNMRNLAIAITSFETAQRRLPASGNWRHDAALNSFPNHTWAVTILPYVDQSALYNKWDLNKPITDPANEPLTRVEVPVFQCPTDVSVTGLGDLSYAVNGGVGYTTKHSSGTRDVPVDFENRPIDLNGDGIFPFDTAPSAAGLLSDRDLFKRMGLFFMETWNTDITKRHHALADIIDGSSQTIMLAENVRVGANPAQPRPSFADPDPLLCAFYFTDPCLNQRCDAGHVDYKLANADPWKINSGRTRPEGLSAIPSGFHPGGVIVALADGSVRLLADNIDGTVYAALLTPQGSLLQGLPLQQALVGEF